MGSKSNVRWEVSSCGERIEALWYHQKKYNSENLSAASLIERLDDKQIGNEGAGRGEKNAKWRRKGRGKL